MAPKFIPTPGDVYATSTKSNKNRVKTEKKLQFNHEEEPTVMLIFHSASNRMSHLVTSSGSETDILNDCKHRRVYYVRVQKSEKIENDNPD